MNFCIGWPSNTLTLKAEFLLYFMSVLFWKSSEWNRFKNWNRRQSFFKGIDKLIYGISLFVKISKGTTGVEDFREGEESIYNLIPKLAMLTLGVHYEPLNSNSTWKCECVVEFLLVYCKDNCTVHFGIWTWKIMQWYDNCHCYSFRNGIVMTSRSCEVVGLLANDSTHVRNWRCPKEH